MGVGHIILLNWKAAGETIECLDNIRDVGVDAKIVVMDNASGDDSVARIQAWCQRNALRCLKLLEADIEECEVGPSDYDVVVIENSSNHGFAGGNNPGIKFSVAKGRADIVWLLNSDARINKETYPLLIERLRGDPTLGFVGSVIRYFEDPDRLQCFGGMVIHERIGKCSLYKKNLHVSDLGVCVESDVDCLMGASLAFPARLVEEVGVMEEAYFMYAEEIDWQLRARAKGWRIGIESGSHIFHKGAQSTKDRSHMYHFYINRASVMFSKRFYGRLSLLTVIPSLFSIVFLQNWKSPKNILFGWRGILVGASYEWPKS